MYPLLRRPILLTARTGLLNVDHRTPSECGWGWLLLATPRPGLFSPPPAGLGKGFLSRASKHAYELADLLVAPPI
jgi:hypothetical protein